MLWFFDTSGFIPRGICGNWPMWIRILNQSSNLVIALAYLAIPAALIYFARKFPQRFRGGQQLLSGAWWTAAFVFLCGLTHFCEFLAFYWPAYHFFTMVLFATAIVSVRSVSVLVRAVVYALGLEDVSRAKDQFMAVLSHELRTPLTPALILADALSRSDEVSEKARVDLCTIKRGLEIEIRLIEDLLDISRSLKGNLSMQSLPVDIHSALAHAISFCKPIAEKKGVHLETELMKNEPYIQGDPGRVRQILWNIIGNAVKFTPKGGIVKITTRISRMMLEVVVDDTGIGIDPTMIRRIFEPFTQAKRSVSDGEGGLGLGLSISRALADAQGGSLVAKSDGIGLGSTFILQLPMTIAPAPIREIEVVTESVVEFIPAVILLVEDHPVTRDVLSKLLRQRGYDVVEADSVSSAMSVYSETKVDILFSDLGLPDGTGYDIIRQVDVPGIAFSGYGTADDRKMSLDAGFLMHITKPVDIRVLSSKIQEIIRGIGTKIRKEKG